MSSSNSAANGATAPATGNGIGDGPSTRVDVITDAHSGARILCVADVRGKISLLNQLAAEHNAKAIIHTGDFGFYEAASLPRVSDRTLRHLVQYSALIDPQFRAQLLQPSLPVAQLRQMLLNPPVRSNGPAPSSSAAASSSAFALTEFPKLLTGELKLSVPVYTVWGACEDVGVLERIRVSPPAAITVPTNHQQQQGQQASPPAAQPNWSIPNLTVLSESVTRILQIGGIRLRLFGLGGACVQHKMFDNGEGQSTIAGGQGTMWTTMLQIGELIDTAHRVYDPSETRLLVTHASPGREGLIAQVALALKADLTVSASLHFRYGVSYNEFSVQPDQESFKSKFSIAKSAFNEVWDTVKSQVESVVDDGQRKFLNNALAVTNRVPAESSAGAAPGSGSQEESAWKNTWNWNLPDAAFGNLILDIKDGRIGSEMRSQGFNFAYRAQANKSAPTGPAASHPQNAPSGPSKPGHHQQQKPSHPQQQQQAPLVPKREPTPSGSPAPTGPAAQSNQSQQHNQQRGPQQHQPSGPKGRKEHRGSVSDASTASKPQSVSGATDAADSATGGTGSAASPNIDRPSSSASGRRPSHHKQHSKAQSQASKDDSAAANAGGEQSAGENADPNASGRGRGRGGRGRGDNNRGGPRGGGEGKRGRGNGPSRQASGKESGPDGSSAPASANTTSSTTSAAPAASAPAASTPAAAPQPNGS